LMTMFCLLCMVVRIIDVYYCHITHLFHKTLQQHQKVAWWGVPVVELLGIDEDAAQRHLKYAVVIVM